MAEIQEAPKFWEPFTLFNAVDLRKSNTKYDVSGIRKLERRLTSLPGTVPVGHLIEPAALIYPEYKDCGGVDELLPRSGFSFTQHLVALAGAHRVLRFDLNGTNWSHAFVWRDGKNVMTDVWSTKLDDDQYPQTTIRVFRGLDEADPISEGLGHVGADTMFVMGLEEQYRRRVTGMGGTISQFLKRDREHMPEYPEGYIAYARLRRR